MTLCNRNCFATLVDHTIKPLITQQTRTYVAAARKAYIVNYRHRTSRKTRNKCNNPLFNEQCNCVGLLTPYHWYACCEL